MYKYPDIYHQAERRVRSKAKFFKHFFVYLVVNGFITVTALMNGELAAPLFLASSWGVGLVFHYLKVFGFPGNGVLSREWEDKEYRKEVARLAKKQETSISVEEKLDLREMAKNYRDSDLV